MREAMLYIRQITYFKSERIPLVKDVQPPRFIYLSTSQEMNPHALPLPPFHVILHVVRKTGKAQKETSRQSPPNDARGDGRSPHHSSGNSLFDGKSPH